MDAARSKAWTVLIYTSASRDLEVAVRDSLEEITRGGGPPQDVRVVAQMGAGGSSQRYQLHQVDQPQPLQASQPGDLSDPKELSDFLLWGMQKYPAEHYAVVLGGHGAGFAGAVTNAARNHMISLPEIERALGGLPQKPDLVIFNTCLMAQAEVAHQLQSTTSSLVGSQSELRGLGLPLAAWMQNLPQLDSGPQAADALVRASAEVPERAPEVASIDLRRWPLLATALDGLAESILENPQAADRLRQHLQQQPHHWPHPQDRPLIDQLDVGQLCASFGEDKQLPENLRKRALLVGSQLSEVCQSSQAHVQGLSLYAPDRPFAQLGPPSARVGETYAALAFARDTRWDEAITFLAK